MALTDSDIHEPPMTGTYHYNTFKAGSGGFPDIGESYVDPVFSETITRLTNSDGTVQGEDIYGHHWSNADGTYCFSYQNRGGGDQLYILNTTTGADVHTSQPTGSVRVDIAWHPTDPDKYYYYSGAILKRRNLAAQTDTNIKTFAATLQALGGSVNWMDRTGRYMVVKYSNLIHLWDSQTDTLYSGAFTPVTGTGWSGITPDGNYVVNGAGTTAQPNKQHHSYALNHTTDAIAASPVQFWGISGDHMEFVSASDGKNYAIAPESNTASGIWRVDITLNQAGRTAAQQRADNLQLVPLPWTMDMHFSGVSAETLSDWAFADIEELVTDDFNEVPTGWYAYEQEIIAMNVVTQEVRRLAHHRSRNIAASYNYQPRVTCAWDGSVVLWMSNYNDSTPAQYADMYAIHSPTGEAGDQTVVPGVATLTLTTFAPAVTSSGSFVLTPSTLALTLTTFAPSIAVTAHQLVTPGVRALTLTTFVPVVTATDPKLVTPGVGTLALTTFAPIVTASNPQLVIPGVATLTISTFAPTVTASGQWLFTNVGRRMLLDGTFDLDGDSFNMALLTSGSDIGAATTLFSDVTAEHATENGYTAGGIPVTLTLAGTTTVTVDVATDPVWTATGGNIIARFAAIYEVGANVLCYGLMDVTATAGNTLTVATPVGVFVVI